MTAQAGRACGSLSARESTRSGYAAVGDTGQLGFRGVPAGAGRLSRPPGHRAGAAAGAGPAQPGDSDPARPAHRRQHLPGTAGPGCASEWRRLSRPAPGRSHSSRLLRRARLPDHELSDPGRCATPAGPLCRAGRQSGAYRAGGLAAGRQPGAAGGASLDTAVAAAATADRRGDAGWLGDFWPLGHRTRRAAAGGALPACGTGRYP